MIYKDLVFGNKMLVNEILLFLGFNLRDIQLSNFFAHNGFIFANILKSPSIEGCVQILKFSDNIGKFIEFLDKVNPLLLPQLFKDTKKNIQSFFDRVIIYYLSQTYIINDNIFPYNRIELNSCDKCYNRISHYIWTHRLDGCENMSACVDKCIAKCKVIKRDTILIKENILNINSYGCIHQKINKYDLKVELYHIYEALVLNNNIYVAFLLEAHDINIHYIKTHNKKLYNKILDNLDKEQKERLCRVELQQEWQNIGHAETVRFGKYCYCRECLGNFTIHNNQQYDTYDSFDDDEDLSS